MILVTALNGKPFYLNPTLIYQIEEMPDTLITLTDGKTLVDGSCARSCAAGDRVSYGDPFEPSENVVGKMAKEEKAPKAEKRKGLSMVVLRRSS